VPAPGGKALDRRRLLRHLVLERTVGALELREFQADAGLGIQAGLKLPPPR